QAEDGIRDFHVTGVQTCALPILLCMDQMAWRAETLTRLRADGDAFRQELIAAGFAPLPTTVNYFLVPVSAPTALRRALLERRLEIGRAAWREGEASWWRGGLDHR